MWTFEVRERARQAALAPHVAVSGPLLAPGALPRSTSAIRRSSRCSRRAARTGGAPDPRAQAGPGEDPLHDESPIGVSAFRRPSSRSSPEAHGQGVRVAAHAFHQETAAPRRAAGVDVLVHDVTDMPVDDDFVTLRASTTWCSRPLWSSTTRYQRTFAAADHQRARPALRGSRRSPRGDSSAASSAQVIAARREQAAELLAHPTPVPAENRAAWSRRGRPWPPAPTRAHRHPARPRPLRRAGANCTSRPHLEQVLLAATARRARLRPHARLRHAHSGHAAPTS